MNKKLIIIISIVIVTFIVIIGVGYFAYDFFPREKSIYDEISYKIEEKENEVIETVYYANQRSEVKKAFKYIFENDKIVKIEEATYFKNISDAKLFVRDNAYTCLELTRDKNIVKNSITTFEHDKYSSRKDRIEYIEKVNKECGYINIE